MRHVSPAQYRYAELAKDTNLLSDCGVGIEYERWMDGQRKSIFAWWNDLSEKEKLKHFAVEKPKKGRAA